MRLPGRRLLAVVAVCAAVIVAALQSSGPVYGQARHRPTVSSPSLSWLRLFGGAGTERGAHLALGGRSNVFLAGTTTSRDWPVTWSATCAQKTCRHGFLTKLSPDGYTYVFYRRALGGSRDTAVNAVAVDSAGNAYLAGNTTSPDFPAVRPFQPRCGGRNATACDDAFIAKVDPRGKLVYSTFLGGRGSDAATSIAVDRQQNIYVAGITSSPDFPIAQAAQPRLRGEANGFTGFVAKLDPSGRHLIYSTYLGGSKRAGVNGIAVDRLGEVYVTGATDSPDFRTSAHSLQPRFIGGDCTFFGCDDAFVSKLGTRGRFLAGSFIATPADDGGNAIALDPSGNVYLAGRTGSSRIPSATPAPPASKTYCGEEGDIQPCYSAYVLQLTPDLRRLQYSRVFSGNGLDSAIDLAVNSRGQVTVTGYTESNNFLTVNPIQKVTGGGDCPEAKGESVPCDGFMAVIAPHNRAPNPCYPGRPGCSTPGLIFSTYLGGNGEDEIESVALDGHGNAYLAGTTWSTNGSWICGIPGCFPSAAPSPPPKVFLARVEQLYR